MSMEANISIVKTELATTSKKRPFAYNDLYFCVCNSMCMEHKATFEQWTLVNNGHYFGVQKVVVAHRFDCASQNPTKVYEST